MIQVNPLPAFPQTFHILNDLGTHANTEGNGSSIKKNWILNNIHYKLKVRFTLKGKRLVGDQKMVTLYSVSFLRTVEVTGFVPLMVNL